MNAELKAKWVEALRSGKYAQGIGHLRRNESYCCLGVLCDLIDPALVSLDGKVAGPCAYNNIGMLPAIVADSSGYHEAPHVGTLPYERRWQALRLHRRLDRTEHPGGRVMTDNTTNAWLQLLAALNAEGNSEFDEEHELPALLRKMAE